MIPITLPVAELKPALTGLGKVLNPRAALPVLQHVKIERTSDGWIALTGTDLDCFVTVRLEHPADGPAVALLVPFEQLQQITKNCGREESLLLEPSEEGPLIKFALADNFGAAKVKLVPVQEFPQTPRLKADAIPLNAEFRQYLHEAMDCASSDSTRRILNGTFIDTSRPKAHYLVATDGQHLYSANSFALPLKHSLIIPEHKFLGWREFNQDGEWQLKADDERVQLSSRRWRFITRQLQGSYPNWRAPVPAPETIRTSITLDPASLEALTKLITRMPCHDARHQTLGLQWQDGQLMLLGKEAYDAPWCRVPVPESKGEGPDLTVFLNRRFLLKALQFGLHTLGLIDEMSPLRFSQGGRQMIVMPVRCEAPEPCPQPAEPQGSAIPKTPTMNNTDTATAPRPIPTESQPRPLEAALVQIEAMKTGFREAVMSLTRLGDTLRGALREQKVSDKDMQNVRQTLHSLQRLRL